MIITKYFNSFEYPRLNRFMNWKKGNIGITKTSNLPLWLGR